MYNVIKILRKGDAVRAAISIVSINKKKGLLKDYSHCNFIMREFGGVWLLSREMNILAKLKGIQGVPNVITRISPTKIIYEYVDAESVNRNNRNKITYDGIIKLQKVVEEINNRGVIHFDLRQRKNIMFSNDQIPYIVDFATSFYFARASFFFSSLFNLLAKVDKSAVLKLKYRLFPSKLSDSEISFLKKFQAVRNLWVFRRKRFKTKDLI